VTLKLICKVYPILRKSPLLRILTPTICYWKCSLDEVGFADSTRIGDTGVIELIRPRTSDNYRQGVLPAEEVWEEQAEEEVRGLRSGPSSGDQVLHKRHLSSQPTD
jgi:hypothetical protein